MAAQQNQWKQVSTQPNKEIQLSNISVNSSWEEIYSELTRIQTELSKLKEVSPND